MSKMKFEYDVIDFSR